MFKSSRSGFTVTVMLFFFKIYSMHYKLQAPALSVGVGGRNKLALKTLQRMLKSKVKVKGFQSRLRLQLQLSLHHVPE